MFHVNTINGFLSYTYDKSFEDEIKLACFFMSIRYNWTIMLSYYLICRS